MFNLFNQPYPANNGFGSTLRRAALIGLFVGLFLLAFQPFGLNNWHTPNKLIKILGFGAITFLITTSYCSLLPALFPRYFSDEKWTVGREIIFICVNILLISLANRFYLQALLNVEDHMSWASTILITFLIGAFPVTGLVLWSYIRRLKKYSQAAAALPIHHPSNDNTSVHKAVDANSPQPLNDSVTLIADNEKDKLTFTSDKLLYIESSDNYCTVVYHNNGQLAKPLLRSSLSRLEKQIKEPHIVRCHRSYVVNLNRVERVTGNAQGYKLHLMDGQFQIPVARQYNETLVAELKAL